MLGLTPWFGVFPVPESDGVDRVVEQVLLADRLGLDLVGIQDHPYQRRYVDTWTLLAYLAGRTERVRFFPDVANLPLRHPALLAKAAASLDVLSGGRVELGLGAGAFWDGIVAWGGPRRTPKQSVDHLEIAIGEIREFWQADGKFEGPKPAHDIGIWLGAYKPRMLRMTGALADGWVPSQSYLPPEKVDEAMKRIDDAASAEGRDPKAIRRVYNLSFDDGHPSVQQIAGFATELGFDSFVFSPQDVRDLEEIAHDVIPAVKEEVSRRRNRDGAGS